MQLFLLPEIRWSGGPVDCTSKQLRQRLALGHAADVECTNHDIKSGASAHVIVVYHSGPGPSAEVLVFDDEQFQ